VRADVEVPGDWRHDQTWTLVATQVPVEDWHARFPDPTIADATLPTACNPKENHSASSVLPLTMPST